MVDNKIKALATKAIANIKAKDITEVEVDVKEELTKDEKVKSKKKEEVKPSFAERRAGRLNEHLAAVAKKFTEGGFQIAANSKYKAIQRLSTGLLALDHGFGGGIPRGRISVICGGWSACKTRIALSVIADAQKRSVINNKYLWEDMPEEERIPYNCAFVDIEGSLDLIWAKKCGVDLEKLHLCRPTCQEEAAEIIITAISSGAYDLVVLDSLAQMLSSDETEAAMDETGYGTSSPKKNNLMFKKVQSHLNKISSDPEMEGVLPTLIVINQIRVKISKGPSWGGPQVSRPGGSGQDFWASCIVNLYAAKVEHFDEAKQFPSKAHFGFLVDKNKTSSPKVNGEFIMAVADEAKGKFQAGEFLETDVVLSYCEQFDMFKKIMDGKWEFKGKIYKTKSEIIDKFINDPKMLLPLKQEIIDLICPKK